MIRTIWLRGLAESLVDCRHNCAEFSVMSVSNCRFNSLRHGCQRTMQLHRRTIHDDYVAATEDVAGCKLLFIYHNQNLCQLTSLRHHRQRVGSSGSSGGGGSSSSSILAVVVVVMVLLVVALGCDSGAGSSSSVVWIDFTSTLVLPGYHRQRRRQPPLPRPQRTLSC